MTLDEALSDARATFPNFPNEAFTLWLDDRIRQNGWPPFGLEWAGFLDGMPVSYWQNVEWARREVTLTPEELSENAFSLVMNLVEAGSGRSNIMSAYIPNTAERFASCMKYVRAHRTTPGLVLLHRTARGVSVVDGNHRVAALLAYQSLMPAESPALPFTALVASPR